MKKVKDVGKLFRHEATRFSHDHIIHYAIVIITVIINVVIRPHNTESIE